MSVTNSSASISNNKMIRQNYSANVWRRYVVAMTIAVVIVISFSCSVADSKIAAVPDTKAATNSLNESAPAGDSVSNRGAMIEIEAGGPADTVRAFYKLLRERKFREAIFLTNLRPAIEGLTESELKEFAVDFEAIAVDIPAEIQINGEIISGDDATVTANLPDPDSGEKTLEQIKLRKSNDVWVILTVDEMAEAKIKQEGKNYFYNLRIETHEDEARKMLERISKAELAHSLQNGGLHTDLATLVAAGYLPDDIRTSESTGYIYEITVSGDKKTYFATATPAVYDKSGRLSFLLIPDPKGISKITSKNNGGKPMRK